MSGNRRRKNGSLKNGLRTRTTCLVLMLTTAGMVFCSIGASDGTGVPSTTGGSAAGAVMAADQLIDYLETGNIRNSVNFPTLVLERNGGCRLAFSNRNVPKILGKVLSLLADHNLNVLDMLNKSRDEIAYNLIDVECEIPPALLPAIRAVEGVIDLRVIPG